MKAKTIAVRAETLAQIYAVMIVSAQSAGMSLQPVIAANVTIVASAVRVPTYVRPAAIA